LQVVLDGVDADLAGARTLDAELCGGSLGQVDDAVTVERPAIIDLDLYRLSRALVGDANDCAERKRLVRCGHGVLVKPLAGSRCLAVEPRSVPGGTTALCEGGAGNGKQQARCKGGCHNDVLSQCYCLTSGCTQCGR